MAGHICRKRWVAALVAGAMLAAGASTPLRHTGADTQRPANILLITIETLRRDHCSLYGYERRTTSFLEELAGECVVFDDAWSPSSWTRPALASIMTGLLPSVHGCTDFQQPLPQACRPLAERLSARGYGTAGFVGNPMAGDPALGFNRGFAHWQYDKWEAAGDKLAKVASWLADAAPPWFVWVHLADPHDPYEPPESTRGRWSGAYESSLRGLRRLRCDDLYECRTVTPDDLDYVQARYDEEILYVDESLRGFFAESAAALRDSYVVITADHGEQFLEHGRWGHPNGIWPEETHIPLLVRRPGMGTGERRTGPVSTRWLFGAMLTWAGCGRPGGSEPGLLLAEPYAGHVVDVESLGCPSAKPQRSWRRETWRARVTADAVCIAQPGEPGRRFDRRLDPLCLQAYESLEPLAVVTRPLAPPDSPTDTALLGELRDLGYL
jgi:arylsulfatase A-like enzyme